MAATGEFLRDYCVEIRGNGQRRWPDEVKALIAAETLKPGVTVNAVAAPYGLLANQLSEWRRPARHGRLVLPAVEDDSFCFAPVMVSDGGGGAHEGQTGLDGCIAVGFLTPTASRVLCFPRHLWIKPGRQRSPLLK